jgi:nucleotide-binding universal stress UspA family protein
VTEHPRPQLLIGFDGSDAAGHAIDVAGLLVPGARATVVTVRDTWKPLEHAAWARIGLPDAVLVPAAQTLEQEAAQAAAARAEQGRRRALLAGFDAECLVEDASRPWRGLAAVARRVRADAIVCGAHGRGGVARAVLGTTTDALLHHAPSPVLVVPPGAAAADGPLLIGYDGSPAADEAIRVAARLFTGRRALVVRVWKSPFERSYAGEALDATPLDDVQLMVIDVELAFAADAERAASAGAALALDLGLDAQALPVRADLGAWRGLERTAESERAAVVVVGSRGRGALAATLLGSVSSGLAHNAARPLLIARAPAQSTPETAEATSTITHSATGATLAD